MSNDLKELLDEIKSLKRQISLLKVNTVSKKDIRIRAEEIGKKWFTEYIDELKLYSFINEKLLQNYSECFKNLIKISSPNNLKSSYLNILEQIIKKFRDEIIIPIQQNPNSFSNESLLKKYLNEFKYEEESQFLKEAFECARNKHYRASAVLGWCAAIDRIHKKIEQLGFTTFNVTSSAMASQQKGRFKKFSSPQNVNSLSELREVFDNIILWVIEGMSLIESNQQTRLKSCFDLRCQCAHPCDAPVTEYNLLSFFSDLHEIIFNNVKFDLS